MQAFYLCYKTQNMTNTIQGTACQKKKKKKKKEPYASHADRWLGTQLEFLGWRGTGRDQLPGGLGFSSHKISSNGATKKETQAKTTEGPAHTSRLSGGTRRVADKTTKGETRVVNNNVCPENTTQLVFCGSRKEGPSVFGPIRPAQQRQESRRRERGSVTLPQLAPCRAEENEHKKTPPSRL